MVANLPRTRPKKAVIPIALCRDRPFICFAPGETPAQKTSDSPVVFELQSGCAGLSFEREVSIRRLKNAECSPTDEQEQGRAAHVPNRPNGLKKAQS